MIEGKDSMSKFNDPYSGSLAKTKHRVKQIAHELCYPFKVQRDIEKAQSVDEIDRIMRSARKGEYE